jgi:GntR family transcriptional regulator/MocR family aminotransferase
LRLGFLIAPHSLHSALRTAKRLTDWQGELPTQAALARFIEDGLLARHIRKSAREYSTRQAMIVEAIRRDFGRWLRVIPSAAGLHVATRLTPGASIDLRQVARRAEAWGIMVDTLSSFSVASPVREGLVIGYGAIPTERIREGLSRLAKSVRRA